MNTLNVTATSAMLLAMVVCATPAIANSGNQDERDRRQERAVRARPNTDERNTRADGARDRAVPRNSTRIDSVTRGGDRQYANQQTDRRQTDSRQYAARRNDSQRYDSRQYSTRQYDARRYDSRQYDTRQYYSRPYNNWAYSTGRYGSYSGYGYRPYISRSRVRFGLGLSIFAGSPFGFRFDYGWAPRYAYRFPLRPGIGYGGMSFLIDPDDAAIYVDGQYIGIARDFDGQPLPLAAGVHEIELQAVDCEPVVFDISVRPGQVIPYRGSLMPYR